MAGVYGAETADRHTDADERYLLEVAPRPGGGATPSSRSCCTGPTAPASSCGGCRRSPVDLLVVGSHGHGLVRDLLLGQTVDRVRHGLDIPMLITRPSPPPRRRAAAPTAPTGRRSPLSRSGVGPAIGLSRTARARGGVKPGRTSPPSSESGPPSADVDRFAAVKTRAVRAFGSMSQTSRVPASKYSRTLRPISALVLPLLSTSTARSMRQLGHRLVGRFRPGRRSQEMNVSRGCGGRPVVRLQRARPAPAMMPRLCRRRKAREKGEQTPSPIVDSWNPIAFSTRTPSTSLAGDVLAVEDVQDILLGGGAGGRAESDARRGDAAEALRGGRRRFDGGAAGSGGRGLRPWAGHVFSSRGWGRWLLSRESERPDKGGRRAAG